MSYKQISLIDLLETVGEDTSKRILSTFSCPKSQDVEYYLHEKAVELARHNDAPTHLIFDTFDGKPILIAYFTITTKSISVTPKLLGLNMRKRLLEYAIYDRGKQKHILKVSLIAQLGKNFTNNYERRISGDDLLQMACDKIKISQAIIGGKFAYLECEDVDFLKKFYTYNGFVEFGKRKLEQSEKGLFSSNYLVQLLKFID